VLAAIEEMRERKLGEIVVLVQAAIRGWVSKEIYHRLKRQGSAAVVVQRNVRKYLTFKNWLWFQLFNKARPLLTRRKIEEDLKKMETEIKDLKNRN